MNATVEFIRDERDRKVSRVHREITRPTSIRAFLDSEGIDEFDWPTVCVRNGRELGRSQWKETTIGDADVVHFISLPLLPQGGQAGQDAGKNIAWFALLMFVNPMLGGFAAFIPNPLLQEPRTTKKPKKTYSLKPEGSKARLGSMIPVAYGRIKVEPDWIEQWAEYHGQTARFDKNTSSPSKKVADQYLYQVFPLTCGYASVESVWVGNTNARGFDEVEWAAYQPGEEITLIPKAVVSSPDVNGQELKGPNHPAFDPEEEGMAPTGGQIRPFKAGTGITGTTGERSFYYTASGGGNGTSGAGGIPAIDSVSGISVGYLDDSDIDFLNDTDLVSANLIGKQVYIGGAQTEGLNYENFDHANWNNAATAIQHYKIIHPDRLRTIVGVQQHRLIVRPAWHGSYTPTNGTNYHIRDDYIGGFAVNASETTIDSIGIDVGGPPQSGTSKTGEWFKLAIGLRFECRRINDSDAAWATSEGDWKALGIEYTEDGKDAIATGREGTEPCRRSTFVIYGAGAGVQSVGLSEVYKLADFGLTAGRYEVRGRRPTSQKLDSRYSHSIYWVGLKGYLIGNHTYADVTTLAVKSRSTGDLQALASRQISAIIKREIEAYGIAHAAVTLGSNPIAIDGGSKVATIDYTAHGLVVGQTFTLSGVSGNPGGVTNATWNTSHTVASIEPDSFTFELANAASTTTAGAGGSSVTLTSSAGWVRGFTQSPAWVIADQCCDTLYGASMPRSQIELGSFQTNAATWANRGTADDGTILADRFNGVFEEFSTVRDVANQAARVGRARVIQTGRGISIVRDEPRVIRSAFFSDRNIVRDSFLLAVKFPQDDTSDCAQVQYFDEDQWKTKLVPATSELSGTKPEIIEMVGVTNRRHGMREALYETAQKKYRRRGVKITSDYEGHIPTVFDKVSITHGMPRWGQAGDVTGYNAGTHVVTCSEPLTWETVGGELVENWNFELGLDGWSSFGTNVGFTQTSEDASHGDYSARLIKNSGGNNVLQLKNTTSITDLTNGTHYTITADVRAGSVSAEGKLATVVLRLTGGAQGQVDRVSATKTLSDTWQTITLATTIDQPDRTIATIMVGIRGSGGSGDAAVGNVVLVDNVHAYKTSSSVQHYIAFQEDNGAFNGPVLASPVVGHPDQVLLLDAFGTPGPLTFTPTTALGTRERTRYKFGRSDNWHRDMIVMSVRPGAAGQVELELVNEDDRIHAADGVTYVPPTDEETLNEIPEAPVIGWVLALVLGPLSARKVRAMWQAAKGAKSYIVEISEGGVGDRRVDIEANYIVSGPFTLSEPVASFDATPTYLPSTAALSTSSTVGQTHRAYISTGTAHGLTTGDYVFLAGFPEIAGIPASEINGPRQITVDNSLTFYVTTTSAATGAILTPKLNRQTWSIRHDTGARGTAREAAANGETAFDYVWTSGAEIAANQIVGGLTSKAYFFAGSDSEPNTSWTRLGTGTTTAVHLEGDLVKADIYPAVEVVAVRVRAVGSLLGPWAYCTAALETATTLNTGVTVQMDGGVVPPANDFGMLLRKSAWVIPNSTSPLTGTIISVDVHHRIRGIEVDVVTGVNNGSTLIVGNVGDADAYMTSAFWTSGNPLSVVGMNQLSLFSVEGGQTGVGASLGKYSSAAQVVGYTFSATGMTPASMGKILVTVIYEYVTPDPTL